MTGDGTFATSGRSVEKTAKKFGHPPKPGQPDARWALLTGGGRSNLLVPSVALDGTKVVVASSPDRKTAEAITFTPSRARDVESPKVNPIASGYATLGDPVLLPRPGGGLQVLLAAAHSDSARSGVSFVPRNPDGTFGPPVLATKGTADIGGAAVLAPDGAPLWATASAVRLVLWRGATNSGSADLSSLSPGTSYIPSVGRDALGRYWVAWYSLGSSTKPLTSGLFMLRFDPSSLRPIGGVERAPKSGSISNENLRFALACARSCRLFYHEDKSGRGERLVSWAPGERAATVVANAKRTGEPHAWLAAAYTSGGRLWTAWFDVAKGTYRAQLGDARGAGGKSLSIGKPQSSGAGYAISLLTIANDLVFTVNWQQANGVFARFANVVPAA